MNKLLCYLCLLAVLTISVAAQQTPPVPAKPLPATPVAPKTHLKVGDAAPDFTLTDTAGKPIKLSDYKGKKSVVLAFYVLAFTGG